MSHFTYKGHCGINQNKVQYSCHASATGISCIVYYEKLLRCSYQAVILCNLFIEIQYTNPVRNFCKQTLAAPPSIVILGKHFLKSEQKEEQGENQTVKTKKSPPLRGGGLIYKPTKILLIFAVHTQMSAFFAITK